jgi:predicted type IV restriction endonuclease
MKSSEECYQEFNRLLIEFGVHNLAHQSEADTRAKVIDRMLRDVLNWPETSIVREPYTNTGFLDYKLLAQKPVVVIEAKKAGDTFVLPPDASMTRALTVGGIIRTAKNLKEHTDQAIQYCAAAGIPYAVVTNGSQWLFFVGSRTDGLEVLKGKLLEAIS